MAESLLFPNENDKKNAYFTKGVFLFFQNIWYNSLNPL